MRAVPAAPLMVEHCSHSLLLCRNHFHSGFRLRRIYEPSKTWYRCLTDCEPWWMMAWTGIAKFKSNTFWHRKFVTGAIVDGDWVVVEDSFEEGTGVSVVQRKEEQELRSTKVRSSGFFLSSLFLSEKRTRNRCWSPESLVQKMLASMLPSFCIWATHLSPKLCRFCMCTMMKSERSPSWMAKRKCLPWTDFNAAFVCRKKRLRGCLCTTH